MKTKKLAILTPGFPKSESDSCCLPFLQQFVLELNRRHPELEVCVLAFDYPYLRDKFCWKNNTIHAFNGSKLRKIGRLYKWKLVWDELKRIKQTGKLLGVLSFWAGECAALGKLFGSANRIPHYCWLMGQDAKSGNRYIQSFCLRAESIIAISDFVQEEFEKNYGVRPEHVIPIGIPEGLVSLKETERSIDIMGAGSLIELKQFNVFVEIVLEVKKRYPNIQTRISGSGPAMPKLKEMVEEHNLGKTVELTGELKHSNVLESMTSSKIFLHTSSYEGMPAVCLEALAAGCQVVSFVRPMNQQIPKWYTFSTKEKIIEKIVEFLKDANADYEPFIPFTIQESTNKILELFCYSEDIMS